MSDLQPLGGGNYVPPAPPAPAPASPVLSPGDATYSRPAAAQNQPPRYEEDPDKPPAYLYGIGGVAALALLGWGGYFLIPPAPVAAVAAYVPFAAADDSFTCELPDKWRVEAQGAASTRKDEVSIADGVVAKQSDAHIEITYSSVAGLITGQLMYGGSPVPDGLVNSRARPIFVHHGKGFKKHFKNYKETKITPTMKQLPKMTGLLPKENSLELIPDIRLAEFTASGNAYGMGGKRHGYRMAVGGSAKIMSVVCECSERDWKKLKPGFEKVMASLTEPRPAGMPGGVPVPGGGVLPTGGGVPGFGAN